MLDLGCAVAYVTAVLMARSMGPDRQSAATSDSRFAYVDAEYVDIVVGIPS